VVGTVYKVGMVVLVADTSAGDIAVDAVAGNAEVGGIVAAGGACRCRHRVDNSSARTGTAGSVAGTVGTAVNGHGDHCFAFAGSLQTLWILGLPVVVGAHYVDTDSCLAYFVRDQRCLEMRIARLTWATAAAAEEDSNDYKQTYCEEAVAGGILVAVSIPPAAACGGDQEMTVVLSETRAGQILVYF
jgi:hypothetical protein